MLHQKPNGRVEPDFEYESLVYFTYLKLKG